MNTRINVDVLKQKAAKLSKPIIVITPVNRYLGFSAPIPPSEQLKELASLWGVPLEVHDPQKLFIKSSSERKVEVYTENGLLDGSVFFGFGHDQLDRQMVRYAIIALEKLGKKVINGEKALTYSDDKALMAIALSNSELPIPNSIISGARASVDLILGNMALKKNSDEIIFEKPTGFSAGGIGISPLLAKAEYISPAIWSSRADSRPRVLQTDMYQTPIDIPRKVIRAYIVGGELIGAYVTSAKGFVNCAGLSKEEYEAFEYDPTAKQERYLINAARAVGASGYCRIDASGGENFGIIEINPLARIDAEKYNINVKAHLLKYAINLASKK